MSYDVVMEYTYDVYCIVSLVIHVIARPLVLYGLCMFVFSTKRGP